MRRRVLTAGLAASLLLAALAWPVMAVDPIPGRPIPDEPPVIPLTDLTSSSLVIDLDGDGTREVVAIAALDELRGFAAVQAWWVDAEGSVEASNQVRLRRSATFDDRVAIGNGIRIDEDGMTGVRLGEPAHLFTVRRDGREVALATGLGENPELTRACCLTIWEVTSEGVQGNIDLRLAAELHSWAAEIVVADLDADGTDELMLVEPQPDPDSPDPGTMVLLTWDGSAYQITRPGIRISPTFIDAGDSDGVPGEDVVAVGSVDGQARLMRLTMRDGSLVREVGPAQEVSSGRILSLPAGPTIMTSDGAFLSLLRWGRDSPPEESLQPNRNVIPLGVFGSGAETLVLGGSPFGEVTALHVFSATGAQWVTIGADLRAGLFTSAASANQLPIQTWTHTGPIPGGMPGAQEAFAFSGMIAVPTPGEGDQIRVAPIALLPGRTISGTAGPGGAWTLLQASQSFVTGQSPRIVTVGALRDAGALELAATASILEPESEAGTLQPTLHGVAPDTERPGQYIVGREAVDFELDAPPGSRIWWSAAPGHAEEVRVGVDGTVRIRLVEPAGGEVEDGKSVVRRVWLVTPVGHTYQGSWIIRVYRQPPRLGIVDEVPFIDLDPMVVGLTLPGSTLTVNGEPARVEDDGTFATPISPGIVPTEFRIAVIDPVGNRTEQLITRVWPLDYRQLPWVPIVVFVLLTVAGLLYVWEPQAHPRRRTSQDEESTFEEIGG